MKDGIIKTGALAALTTAMLALPASAQPRGGQESEAFRAAMDTCRNANPPPADRPARGTPPTEAQRQAFEAHMTAMKTCMSAAGFTLPDRPHGPPRDGGFGPRRGGGNPPPDQAAPADDVEATR